ncbi:MAG: fatty acid amide hydrolase 2 [Myxococcota bacterium]|jgi:fatty acid amide hydrolase 2
MQDLLDTSASQLAARIRRRELSPLDLLETHIERIERVNPAINALVCDRFDLARQEAIQAEVRLVNAPLAAPLPPLLGVPCTVQELIGVAGMPQTCGSVYRWDRSAKSDASVVARLKAAGAIVLGVTNVAEASLWLETNNLIYGRTVNPWDPQHTVGGGSGGECALIASGGSPFGLGAGLTSGVRIPASFCGVVAHQPTGHLVPATGLWGLGASGLLDCGPIARRVEDLMLILRIIAGPDEVDATVCNRPLLDPAGVDLSQVTIYPLTEHAGLRISPVMKEAVARSVEVLVSLGARVCTKKLPLLTETAALWGAMITERMSGDAAEMLGDGESIPVLREALRFALGRANHTTSALAMAMVDALRRLLPSRVSERRELGIRLRTELEAVLGDNGVILHPPYTRPAPRHRGTLVTPSDFVLSALFSALGMPATALPVGFDVSGLPLGVQVIGARGADHLTLAVAGALERELGGWVRAQPTL